MAGRRRRTRGSNFPPPSVAHQSVEPHVGRHRAGRFAGWHQDRRVLPGRKSPTWSPKSEGAAMHRCRRATPPPIPRPAAKSTKRQRSSKWNRTHQRVAAVARAQKVGVALSRTVAEIRRVKQFRFTTYGVIFLLKSSHCRRRPAISTVPEVGPGAACCRSNRLPVPPVELRRRIFSLGRRIESEHARSNRWCQHRGKLSSSEWPL